MSHSTRLRRPFAAALALSIAAAGLALAPVASASAASNADNATSVLHKIDTYRTGKGLPKFLRNANLTAYAQDIASYYAAHGEVDSYAPNDAHPKPEGNTDVASFIFKVTGGASTATKAIAKQHRDFALSVSDHAFLFDPNLNYAAVGFATKGKYTYAFIVESRYDKPLQTSVQPSVSGARAVGSTVTAVITGWTPSTNRSYQWYANGSALSGEKSSTFAIGSGSLGKTLSVKVTVEAEGYTPATRWSNETSAVVRGTIAAKTPVVTGTRVPKQTLTAKAGDWGSGVTLTYQWLRSGVAISDAAGSTYKVRSADLDKRVDVRVTGTRTGFTTATRTTATTARVVSEFTTVTPVVGGSGQKAGTVLTAQVGSWKPVASKYTYRWKRDGKNISQAVNKTYKATSADVGHTLTVTVTGTKTGYLTNSVTSAGRRLG